MNFRSTAALAVALGLATYSMSAAAQKSKDTVRFALEEAPKTLITSEDPRADTMMMEDAVFRTPFCLNPATNRYDPDGATSWAWKDDKTLEMKIRTDMQFSDGMPVTVDDVIYTLRWRVDPASKLRFASSDQDWFASAEKVDNSTLLIRSRRVAPDGMSRLAALPILPSHVHGKLADKSTFSRTNPVTNGPYKVASFDQAGVSLVRNEAFVSTSPCRAKPKIANARLVPVPDLQTQLAHLMTDGLDIVRSTTKDVSEAYSNDPRFTVTATQGFQLFYLSMDTINRSGNKALSDKRVRQADRQGRFRRLADSGREVL